jgi:hypothetical protein
MNSRGEPEHNWVRLFWSASDSGSFAYTRQAIPVLRGPPNRRLPGRADVLKARRAMGELNMFEEVPEELREHVREVLDGLKRLEERWPEKDFLAFHRPTSVYTYHPFLFRESFPCVSSEEMRDLSLAAMLASSAACLRDQIMDRPGPRATRAALRVHAMEYEATLIWARHFPPAALFWTRYRELAAASARANLQAHRFASGARPWAQFTDDVARELGACNAALACSTVDALAELSGRDEHREPLRKSIEHYNAARQLWDDACDWRQDLVAGGATLVLALAFTSRPELAGRKRDEALQHELAREIHYRGHIRRVLGLALEELGLAEELAARAPAPLWGALLAHLRRACEGLGAELEGIAARNLELQRVEDGRRADPGRPSSSLDEG